VCWTAGAVNAALLVVVPAWIGLLAGKWIKAPTRRKPAPADDPEPAGKHAKD
jgi:hypothetical protein